MFTQLEGAVKNQIASLIYKMNLVQQPRSVAIKEGRGPAIEASGPSTAVGSMMNEQSETRAQTPVTSDKIGRNDPCPCGSGKKFKKCCGA